MLDRNDFERMVEKLDHVEEIQPPKFSSDWRPSRRHAESGRECTALSRAGLTKNVGFVGLTETRYEGEFCPCGALRHVIDGIPERDWTFINRYFDDPAWPAITTETSEDPSATAPVNGPVR